MESGYPATVAPAPSIELTTKKRRLLNLPALFNFPFRLTLFGRSVCLLLGEFIANVVLWVATVATFAPHQDKRGVISLALLAWTYGLRHGLDMGAYSSTSVSGGSWN